MTMAAAMDGMVAMLAGLPSIAHGAKMAEPDFARGVVTAVVVYDTPAVEFDIEHHNAYAVNFQCQLVATAPDERAAHDALAAAVHDLARLWWSPTTQTLGGVARLVTWSGIDDFATISADDGRTEIAAPFTARAIVEIDTTTSTDGTS